VAYVLVDINADIATRFHLGEALHQDKQEGVGHRHRIPIPSHEAQRRRYYQNLKYGGFQVRPQPKYEWVYLALYGLLHLISLVR
jgi:hypothetical protein